MFTRIAEDSGQFTRLAHYDTTGDSPDRHGLRPGQPQRKVPVTIWQNEHAAEAFLTF